MSLITDLKAYYDLNETSGARLDQTGTYNLTDNNTVGSATGLIDNSASFSGASSESLTNSSALGIAGNGNISISGWVNYASLPSAGSYAVFGHTNTTGADNYFWLNIGTTNFAISTNYGSFCSVAHSFSTNTWYHIVVTRLGSDAFSIYKNGSFLTSCSGGGTSPISAINFSLGSAPNASEYSTVKIDEVGVWSRVISTDEITQLYNSGSGLPYDEFIPSSGSGSYATSTSATSTEALLGSIAFGQSIVIVILFIMMIGFVFNNITKKKWQ